MKKLIIGILVTLGLFLAYCTFAFFIPQTPGTPSPSQDLETVTNPPPAQSDVTPPVITPTESEIDSDGDGFNDWFEENIAHLDPLIPNDRYAVIVGTNAAHPISFWTQKTREQYIDFKNFLVKELGFKPDNVFLLIDENATYSNFKSILDCLINTSDENDLIYIMMYGHGDENGFQFHTGKDPSAFIRDFNVTVLSEGEGWINIEFGPPYDDEVFRTETIYQLDKEIRKREHGEGITLDSLNKLLSEIKYKKMLLTMESCGGNKVIDKLGGENRVVLAPTNPLIVSRELQKTNYLSIKEFFQLELEWSKSPDSAAARSKIFEPKMFDPQGIAVDFYFGEAKINKIPS